MNPTLRNILAVMAGLVVGSAVNGGLISISGSLVPVPEGVDPSNLESIIENMHRYEAKHFIMPILAHAIGTLAGAFIASKLAASGNLLCGMIIGLFFLAGGIYMVTMIPSPTWVILADLTLAYLPMAWIGYKLSGK